MKWFHQIDYDHDFGNRRGIIVERDGPKGKILKITLLIAFTGRKRRLFFQDYRHYVAMLKPQWYVIVQLDCWPNPSPVQGQRVRWYQRLSAWRGMQGVFDPDAETFRIEIKPPNGAVVEADLL